MKSRFYSILVLLSIVWGCEREVSTSPDLIENPVNSKLFIDSEPSGSLIYLNGKITGKETPDTLFWLDDTTHTITLRRPLYRDTTFSMSGVANEIRSIDVKYHENPKMLGRIQCSSTPDSAEVIFNGVSTGEYTPHLIKELIPGHYTVSYVKSGFRSAVYDYEVSSDETMGNNAALEDTSVWVTYSSHNSDMPEDAVWSVAIDKENTVWIGTATAGLVSYKNGAFKTIPQSYFGMEDVAIYKMSVDSSNNLWMGTSQGIVRYDGSSYDIFTTDNSGLPGDVINHIAAHFSTKLWVSTSFGAGVYDNSGWTVYNTSNSEIPGNVINVVNTNVFGEVWIGFSRSGLAIWNGLRFKPISNFGWASGPTAQPYPGNSVYAIDQESNGMTWVGFFPEDFPGGGAGGLTSFDGTRWSNNYSGQISREIYDILVGPDDTKYVATPGGLTVFNSWGDRRFFKTINSGLYSDDIRDLELDRDGNLWLATRGGITKYKRK
ncbi:MAG: hypothetical protein SCALA702_08710 [Melioribacteraceae bacterium]|nr:MAG: hypothetical protein SCALA702_08710 [Melioribacteraceae bacterium]